MYAKIKPFMNLIMVERVFFMKYYLQPNKTAGF